MGMATPFRVNTPSPKPAAPQEPVAPPLGKAVAHSRRSGDPLPLPSENSPDHEPLIPWPAAPGVTHKPMRVK